MPRISALVLMMSALFFLAANLNETPGKVENFTLEDYNGVKHSLSDFKDSRAVVIMFIATQCPVSNAYNKRMAALYKDYKDKNVTFIGINANKQESVEEIREHAKQKGLEFVILKDVNNILADKLEARVTPEIYIVNRDFDLLYHGRIDDNQREERVTSQDLRKALDEVLDGKPVSVTTTRAFGCTIKRVD